MRTAVKAVKLHEITAFFSGEITQTHRLEKSVKIVLKQP